MNKPAYDRDALLKGIKNCDRNLVIFKEAIEKEKKTKIQYMDLVKEIDNGNANL